MNLGPLNNMDESQNNDAKCKNQNSPPNPAKKKKKKEYILHGFFYIKF